MLKKSKTYQSLSLMEKEIRRETLMTKNYTTAPLQGLCLGYKTGSRSKLQKERCRKNNEEYILSQGE
jgi:hypothetical protein